MLREFERQYLTRLDAVRTYEEALRMYEDLWLRAKQLGAIDMESPLDGLEADIEMARTLNALR